MLARGGLLLVILLVAMDAALVVRFVYDRTDEAYLISLAVMQVTAFSALGWWVLQWGLRRWSADRSQWEQLFADATRHYMRNELSAAEQLFCDCDASTLGTQRRRSAWPTCSGEAADRKLPDDCCARPAASIAAEPMPI